MFQILVSPRGVILICRNSWECIEVPEERENHGEGTEAKSNYSISLLCVWAQLWVHTYFMKKKCCQLCLTIILLYTWFGRIGLSLLGHFLHLFWDIWHSHLLSVVLLGIRWAVLCLYHCNNVQLKFLYWLFKSHLKIDCCFTTK